MVFSIKSLLIKQDISCFKIINNSNETKSHSTFTLTVILTTADLIKILTNLVNKELITLSLETDYDICVAKSLINSVWEMNFLLQKDDGYNNKIVRSLLREYIDYKHSLTILGSLDDCHKLNGVFNNGKVKVPLQSFDLLWSSLPLCNQTRVLTISPIESINNIHLPRVGKYKEISTNTSTFEQKTKIVQFNQKQVSKIIGIGGLRLNSIRIQSRCWIHVLPPINDFKRYNALTTSQRNTLQEVAIHGIAKNVEIAVYELKKAANACN